MSTKLDLERLRNRTLLLRFTAAITDSDGCRVSDGTDKVILPDDREVSLLELGYYCRHNHWPVDTDEVEPGCGTDGCVMHLDIPDPDAQDMQLVAQVRPTRTLREIFQEGRRRGWFKGGGGYA